MRNLQVKEEHLAITVGASDCQLLVESHGNKEDVGAKEDHAQQFCHVDQETFGVDAVLHSAATEALATHDALEDSGYGPHELSVNGIEALGS